MNTKRLQFNIGMVVVLFLAVLTSVYYYVPKMFADTVYPLKYEVMIVKYSKQYNVDPALMAGLIFQESRFNPTSVSGAGAQGMLQFMPGTAATMAKETGRWPKYDIFDPETAIQFGCAHVRDLLDKYNGNVDLTLYAYNTGTGSADKYVRSPESIANFPYVRRIRNYQTVYASMYAKELSLEPVKIDKKNNDSVVRGFVWTQIFNNLVGAGDKK